jgi:hypothetical protein
MYAVLRIQKIKKMEDMVGRGAHNDRTIPCPYIDFDRSQNNHIRGEAKDIKSKYDALIDDRKIKVRKNAVLAYELILTHSPILDENLGVWTEKHEKEFLKSSYNWVCSKFGKENVLQIAVHRDEKTPHMHVILVPVDEKGKLNARSFTGGTRKMSGLQSSFFSAVSHLGLDRGEIGSQKEYSELKKYRTRIRKKVDILASESIEELRELAAELLVENENLKKENKKITALNNITHENNKKVLTENQKLNKRIRDLDLNYVMQTVLGFQKDHKSNPDKSIYVTPIGVITITKDGFTTDFNKQKPKKGAIDLVQLVNNLTFDEIISLLKAYVLPEDLIGPIFENQKEKIENIVKPSAEKILQPCKKSDLINDEQIIEYLQKEADISLEFAKNIVSQKTVHISEDHNGENLVFNHYNAKKQLLGRAALGKSFEGKKWTRQLGHPTAFHYVNNQYDNNNIIVTDDHLMGVHLAEKYKCSSIVSFLKTKSDIIINYIKQCFPDSTFFPHFSKKKKNDEFIELAKKQNIIIGHEKDLVPTVVEVNTISQAVDFVKQNQPSQPEVVKQKINKIEM